jgi:hypothetical protein
VALAGPRRRGTDCRSWVGPEERYLRPIAQLESPAVSNRRVPRLAVTELLRQGGECRRAT